MIGRIVRQDTKSGMRLDELAGADQRKAIQAGEEIGGHCVMAVLRTIAWRKN